MNSRAISLYYGILTIGSIAFFIILYIVPLDSLIVSLGDDFAQYIQHAGNICQGHPYSDLPYPFNPKAQIGPPAYPPVYPLLISPLSCGPVPQFLLMKGLSVLFLVLSLFILYKIFQSLTKISLSMEILLIFIFLPRIFLDAGSIGSDLPYAFLSFLALWSLTTLPEDRLTWIGPLVTGLLIALATLTRDIGVALWAGSLLYLGQKRWANPQYRRVFLVQIVSISFAFLIPLGCWKIYQHHLGLDSANTIYFRTGLGLDGLTLSGLVLRLVSNFYYYLQKFYELLFPLSFLIRPITYLSWIRFPIFSFLLGIFFWQILKSFRNRTRVIILYIICYWGILLLMDSHISKNGVRLLIPLTPFFIFFILKGFNELSLKGLPAFPPSAYRIFLLLWFGLNIWGSFSLYSSTRNPLSLSFSPEGPSYKAMVSYIQKDTPAISRIAYIKHRYLALYTTRQTVIPPYLGPPSYVGPPAEILNYLSHWKVSHVLLDDHFIIEEAALRKTMTQFPDFFSPSYSLPSLTLYQFKKR